MRSRKEEVLGILTKSHNKFTAKELADKLQIDRANVSCYLNELTKLRADGIRLDEGFDGNKEAMLSYNPEGLAIELNMSNNVVYLENILSYEANEPFIYGCHNFYPQEGSALPYDFFVSCSQRFKRHGIKTAAFVTSQSAKFGPWDVNDGLPTLEMHRHLLLELQARHLFSTGLIDAVIIGNAYASDEELRSLAAIDRYKLSLGIEFVPQVTKLEKKDRSLPEALPAGRYYSQCNPFDDGARKIR